MEFMIIVFILFSFIGDAEGKEPKCSEPIAISQDGKELNKYDLKMFEFAKIRCGTLYKDAPCLITFIKKGEKNYNVICGEKK